ncbi:MAG: energy-coupling factor transporter ATPase [Clostridia bacterium]|nr:energy-coupling factor transporter ATPase [Clostridia bacterium]
MEKIIETKDISYSYTDSDGQISIVPALSNVSLSVESGEYVAVLGHNGSGKSTLAKLLNLILTPTSGTLYIDGKEIDHNDDDIDKLYDVRKTVGMVFQNPDNQLVATVVEEDVAFGPENLGIEPKEIQKRIDEALETVGMTEYANHATHSLSGGQKQRIAIAGVIAMKPKCIIFDESTAMLDPLGRKEVMRAMERLNREEGITIIHITHYMEEAARADRVIIVNDGEVYMDATPREVFSHVEELRAVGLEAPQATELLHRLRALGYDVPRDCIDADECAEIIVKLIKSEKEKNV